MIEAQSEQTEIHYPLADHSEDLPVEESEARDRVSIRHKLRWLMDKAPSDATAVFFIRHTKNGFKGLLKIHSTQRKFVAGSEATSLSELMDRISDEIKTQFRSWRQVRFAQKA